MRFRLLVAVATLTALATAAACDLNPQPLPPVDQGATPGFTSSSGGSSSSSGAFGGGSEETPAPEDNGDSKAPTDAGTTSDSPTGTIPGDGGEDGSSDAGDSG